MKRLLVVLAGLLTAGAATGVFAMTSGANSSWSLVGTNTVASSPVEGGGYPVPPGSTKPQPPCGTHPLNSNHSESWLGVKPGTEDIVGSSKFFIGKWSTFYDFRRGWCIRSPGPGCSPRAIRRGSCTTPGGSRRTCSTSRRRTSSYQRPALSPALPRATTPNGSSCSFQAGRFRGRARSRRRAPDSRRRSSASLRPGS